MQLSVYSPSRLPESQRDQSLRRILHTVEMERIIIILRIIISFRNGGALSLANNFSVSSRKKMKRKKKESQEGEEHLTRNRSPGNVLPG